MNRSEFEGLLIDMDKMRNSFDSVEVPIEALLFVTLNININILLLLIYYLFHDI